MTTDTLFTTWTDEELRCRIKTYARSLTRSDRKYRALVAKAWESIGEAHQDKTHEYYFWVAKMQMRRLHFVYDYTPMPVVGAQRHAGYIEAISDYTNV